ncbi:hypothetical protein GCM10022254_05040 [Actinomadura meridiana]|uniref:DUF4307 domain-containing protein n=1 Tax=Actinomadura meridiana TaxID=559626 RepID=A0ABP8BTV0_9ACTN
MTTSVSKAAAPAESRRSRLGLVVIGIVAAVAAGGFGIITVYAGQTPGIVAQTVAYRVADTSVTINYTVAKGKGDEVRCTIDAYDKNFTVLSEQEVSVPAGKSSVEGTATLRTSERANGARIHDCRRL